MSNKWYKHGAWILVLALAASVTIGLLGLWPDLHGSDSTTDRHEQVRIASAADTFLNKDASNWYVSRVRLNYLPHRALVEDKAYSTGRGVCYVVAQNFGNRFDDGDWDRAPCDF
jgi:hypothetical protein